MGTRINGKEIAETLKKKLHQEFKNLPRELVFSIIYVGQDPVIDNFIAYKKAFGYDLGVSVVVHHFSESIQMDELEKEIHSIEKKSDAMIVQLPLPEHLPSQDILDMIPVHKDIDVLSTTAKESFKKGILSLYPPVTGAIIEILTSESYDLTDKNIVLVGYGSLVGKPFATLLDNKRLTYTIIDDTTNADVKKDILSHADVIVAGAGVPALITGDMIQKNVVLLDAGTSEAGKRVIGDIDSSCYEYSLFYTPVPGGIGPITIAVLYQNILKSYNLLNNQ
jgi:methylenetetrahydrofolate dehydrogenase (NADP+)/methenyltetrahydrofolate cyclohydrolase